MPARFPGFGQLTGEGGLLRQPVLAQIIEPASELDATGGQRRGPAAVLSHAAAPRAVLCYRGPRRHAQPVDLAARGAQDA